MSDTSTDTDETDGSAGDGSDAELVAQDDGFSARQEYQMRLALAQSLGENLPGDEDYYEVFNWDKDPSVEDFFALALRNPYAYAVTFLPPSTTWRDPPKIDDKDDPRGDADQTEFESDVQDLIDDQNLWHYAKRADKLAGIGKFGVLVLEFDDVDDPDGFSKTVDEGAELTGLRPFSRASVDDVTVGGPGSGRWNEPTEYTLDFSDENEVEGAFEHQGPETLDVHWQRVIHIPSEELLDDELRGVERQRPVYNNLIDIEKTLGAAGQLVYRAAAWGIHINISDEFNLEDNGDDLREHLQRWQHGLENVLRTQGADDVKSLGGEDIDPQPVIDPNIEAISAQTGLPQSVLKGNESGERATTQDLKEWYGKIAERRNEFVEPQIVHAIIDRLLDIGSITEPQGGRYEVDWQPLAEMSESDQADIRKTRAEVLETWMQVAPGVLTPKQQLGFIEDGDLPSDLEGSDLPDLDEADPEVEAQFEAQFGPVEADD
ncbi:phage portal protein [Natrinema sp. DC36]|uniref:anti-CBASS protein Acb1 family protein n=1 Tax=Natrinema sp. DC36 TaxID=2878680 RepID=UPI001CF08BA5|nr:anti-CBASS Acb1 family protein [Natrinema sp. DC36]